MMRLADPLVRFGNLVLERKPGGGESEMLDMIMVGEPDVVMDRRALAQGFGLQPQFVANAASLGRCQLVVQPVVAHRNPEKTLTGRQAVVVLPAWIVADSRHPSLCAVEVTLIA